jgi:hypothetical protein
MGRTVRLLGTDTSNSFIGFSQNQTSYQQVNKSFGQQPEQQPATEPAGLTTKQLVYPTNSWYYQEIPGLTNK